MKTYLYLKLLIIILFTGYGPEIDKITEPSIIPKPLSQKIGNGYFIFNHDVAIVSEPKLLEVSNYFNLYLKENYNFELSNNNSSKKITFKIDDSINNDEGYELDVSKNDITIKSKYAKGAFYAVQSLLQLLPLPSSAATFKIACINIKDEPQFKYRGMHLDVGRHFFSVDFIKKSTVLNSVIKDTSFLSGMSNNEVEFKDCSFFSVIFLLENREQFRS